MRAILVASMAERVDRAAGDVETWWRALPVGVLLRPADTLTSGYHVLLLLCADCTQTVRKSFVPSMCTLEPHCTHAPPVHKDTRPLSTKTDKHSLNALVQSTSVVHTRLQSTPSTSPANQQRTRHASCRVRGAVPRLRRFIHQSRQVGAAVRQTLRAGCTLSNGA